jgi:bifunctional non-homologous end joining protein LigD
VLSGPSALNASWSPSDPPAEQVAAAPAPALSGDAKPAPFAARIDFELATLVDEPPQHGDWLAEVKYDGYRAAFTLENGVGRAFSRSHADWSDKFAPLVSAVEELAADSAIIDGEVVVFDERGVSRFELLQQALGTHPERLTLAAFDLLYLNGYDLREMPIEKRKELLAQLLGGEERSTLRYADHVLGGLDDFFGRACDADLEGMICKRAGSRYVGGRGREWLKVKCEQQQEFVVGGFTEGAGARESLGSVLVGTFDADKLVYHGRVGSGLNEALVASLRKRLEAIEVEKPAFDPPPHITGVRKVHWTRPEIVVEAKFREWTRDGHLRQPVFLGLREDKDPHDVIRERPTDVERAEGTEPVRDAMPLKADASRRSAERSAEGHAGSEVSGERKDRGRVPRPPQTARPTGGPGSNMVLGITITNPEKRLFPDSDFDKLACARYYEAVAPLMFAHVAERPLTLYRCPVGSGTKEGCFWQRHPDMGIAKQIKTFPHRIKHGEYDFLYIDSPDGIVALAQMGVAEIHTWMSRYDEPRRPDRICFDLDPGPDVEWPEIVAIAEMVRDEFSAMGFTPFLKSTGGKGLHVVMPIEPVWEFVRVRNLCKAIVDRLVARHPDRLVGKMAKEIRAGRIFLDYVRNTEGSSAVAPYSTRMREGPTCAVPLTWDELDPKCDMRSMTPPEVLKRVKRDADRDAWSDMDDASAGSRILKAAEKTLEG